MVWLSDVDALLNTPARPDVFRVYLEWAAVPDDNRTHTIALTRYKETHRCCAVFSHFPSSPSCWRRRRARAG